MPIVIYKDGGVGIEYNLPQELKDLITKEFATIMIKEIEIIWPYNKDNDINMVTTLGMQAGTSGVHDAFEETCNKLGLTKFKEASKLDWYDYDLFMDEILNTVGEVFYGKENYDKLFEESMKEWKDAEEAANKTNILLEKE